MKIIQTEKYIKVAQQLPNRDSNEVLAERMISYWRESPQTWNTIKSLLSSGDAANFAMKSGLIEDYGPMRGKIIADIIYKKYHANKVVQ